MPRAFFASVLPCFGASLLRCFRASARLCFCVSGISAILTDVSSELNAVRATRLSSRAKRGICFLPEPQECLTQPFPCADSRSLALLVITISQFQQCWC